MQSIDPYAVIGLLIFGGIGWAIYKMLSSMEDAWDGWRQKKYDTARREQMERIERIKLKHERLRSSRKSKGEVQDEA